MRLLLDEMLSPEIARRLRAKGHDVEAIKSDRPDLEAAPDEALIRRMAEEQRVIVTNNVRDFHPIHQRYLAQGREHCGMLFSTDQAMPRSRSLIPDWVAVLERELDLHRADDALRNQFRFLT